MANRRILQLLAVKTDLDDATYFLIQNMLKKELLLEKNEEISNLFQELNERKGKFQLDKTKNFNQMIHYLILPNSANLKVVDVSELKDTTVYPANKVDIADDLADLDISIATSQYFSIKAGVDVEENAKILRDLASGNNLFPETYLVPERKPLFF